MSETVEQPTYISRPRCRHRAEGLLAGSAYRSLQLGCPGEGFVVLLFRTEKD